MTQLAINPRRVISPAIFKPTTIDVTNMGAIGDGVTDDSQAIEDAIVAVGDYGTILLPPGKTFLLKKSLPLREGLTVIGYGAEIKRCDEIKSTLAASVVGNSTVNEITVSDASGFQVNQECALTVDATDTAAKYTTINRITAINGKTITLEQNVSDTVGSATFTTSDVLIAVVIPFSGAYGNDVFGNANPPQITILGVDFNGNKANNTTGLRWELQREISQVGARSILQNLYIHDTPGEGIITIGDFSKIENIHFEDVNGNGIHLSNGDDVILNNITGSNINIHEVNSTGDIGHQGGLVDYSNGNARIMMTNLFVDGALAVVGSLGSEGDGSALNNINARNCSADYIECLSTLNEFTLTGGTAEDCTQFAVEGDGINIKNVVCIGTPVTLFCDNSNIDMVSKLPDNTTDRCMIVARDNNTVNATCVNGNYGLTFGGGATSNRVTCTLINNYTAALQVSGTANSIDLANVITPHIILESSYTEVSTWRGIDFSQAGIIKGGSITASVGVSSRIVDVRANADNSVIDGLHIIDGSSPFEFIDLGGQDNITVKDCLFPNGTSSTDAFDITGVTNFNPINNYAVGSSTLLTGS